MRILIIGAGPTGLGAAHRLNERSHADFALYDANDYFGGLATSFHDEKGFTWDFAVHVAHSHYAYVDDLMDRLLPGGFYHHMRMAWVREYGAFVPYPFQYNIRHLPEGPREDCVKGLLDLQQQGPPADIRTFEDFILSTAGTGIAQHFMLPYNRKIWTVDPSEMGYQWIGERVPVVDVERVLRNIEENKDDVAWGPNATFQFPKEGGTGAIWKALGETLPREKVFLETTLVNLDPKGQVALFSNGAEEHYDYLISTIPIPELTALCGLADLHMRASELTFSRVNVAGVAPEQPMPEQLRDKTWIYCPEDKCAFYRVTPFSNFSPAHVPDPDRTCSFLCEFASPGREPEPWGDLADLALTGLRDIGLIDADPATTHVRLMHAPYGYPVPTLDRDEILNDVIPGLEAYNIFSRGRFGGWKYEAANMDHSLMQGVEAIDRILDGTEEVTWPTPAVVNAGKR